MRLFQIEEPDGGPADADMPGAAVGIDLTGAEAVVALAIGGNAAILVDRDGFEQKLPVPRADGSAAVWQSLFEGIRMRAERALARPVTHAVIAVSGSPGAAAAAPIAAAAAGLTVLRLADIAELPKGEPPVLAAAIIAEDLAPRA